MERLMDTERTTSSAQMAHADFDRARRRAFMNELASTVRGTPNWLLSFEEVQRTLHIQGQYYQGMQQVPVSEIVGSVDRYRDFDRHFLPTQSFTRPRWDS